ncbi:MAG: zinc-dependent peptidase, partial [Comamonas sp.]
MSLRRFWNQIQSRLAPVPEIDAGLWLSAIRAYPFLQTLALADQAKLRALAALFLQRKQFHGAHGLVVTDAMAVQIAAQACLPLLHWGTPR